MTRVTMVIVIGLLLITNAVAQPLPQPKVGTCPSGYRESGGYCAPTVVAIACCRCQRSIHAHQVGCIGRLLHRDAAALITSLTKRAPRP